MPASDPRLDAFFAANQPWQAELSTLRALLLAAGLAEAFKWRGPCYTHLGGNVATLWGFKEACVIGFFKGALLADPEGILVPPGPNSRAVRMAKFTSLAAITAATPALQTTIQAAIAVEAAGLKIVFSKDDLAYPDELVTALDEDPDLALAFDALTPGRRRGYLLHFAQAKHSATRTARIAKYRPAILDGKGMNDR